MIADCYLNSLTVSFSYSGLLAGVQLSSLMTAFTLSIYLGLEEFLDSWKIFRFWLMIYNLKNITWLGMCSFLLNLDGIH